MSVFIWVKTAWQEDESGAWLIAAYDEWTFESWGEEPDFYVEAVKKARGFDGDARIREMYLNVPVAAVHELFARPHVEVTTSEVES